MVSYVVGPSPPPLLPPEPPDLTVPNLLLSAPPLKPPKPPDLPDPPALCSSYLFLPSDLAAFHISSPQAYSLDLDLGLPHLDPSIASSVVVAPFVSPIPAVCSLFFARSPSASSLSHRPPVCLLLLWKSLDSVDICSTEVFLHPLVAFLEASSPFITLIVLSPSLTQV